MSLSSLAVIRGLVLALLFPLIVSCGKATFTPQEHLARAKDLQEKENLQAAIIEAKNALQQAPDNAEARLLLGTLYVDVGNGAAAEKELQRAQELGVSGGGWTTLVARSKLLQNKFQELLDLPQPDNTASTAQRAELAALRGHAQLGLGKLDATMAAYDEALALDNKSVEALAGKAQLAAFQGQDEEARRWLAEAFAADKDAAPAWSLLGDLERQSGNLEKAEEAYGKAIAARANKGHDLLRRALVRIALKKYPEAQKDIDRLKPWSGYVTGVAYAQGLLELQKNRLNEAALQFQNALKLDAKYLPAKFYLGVTHYLSGQDASALEQLQPYVTAVPGDMRARQLLAIIALRNNQPDLAQKQLATILARQPEDYTSLSLMASALMAGGDTQKAVQYLRKATEIQPDSADIKAQLGLGLLVQGEENAGVAELESAIQLKPELQQTQVTLALFYLSEHKYDEALKVAERLRSTMPDNPAPLNIIGVIQRAKGDEAAARKAWEEAVAKAPGDPAASHNLADLALAAKDVAQARKLYEGVLAKHPEHVLSIAKLADLDLIANQPAQAEARLKKALEANPKLVTTRVALSRFYLSRGQATQALETIRPATEVPEPEPTALALLGEAQLALGDANNAVATLTKLTQRQSLPANHYLLARALLGTGNTRKADEQLNIALKLDKNFLLAQLLKVQIQIGNDQLAAAKQSLAQLKKPHADHPQVLVTEAAIALRENRADDAVRALRAALAKAPDNLTVTQLAMAQWQAGDKDGGLRSIETWLDKHPDDLMVIDTQAKFYLLAGREADAVRSMEQVIKLNPKHLPSLNNLAWLLREKDPARALKYAEQAVELAPESATVLDTQGVVLLVQNKPERAIRALEQAYNKSPKDASIAYHYAQALVGMQQTEQARGVLKKALAQKQTFPQRKEAQALLDKLVAR